MTKRETIQNFIDKFSAIPPHQWCQKYFKDADGRRCSVAHCGVDCWFNYLDLTEEARTLARLFTPPTPTGMHPGLRSDTPPDVREGLYIVFAINDADGHPRDNILAALKALL